MAVSVPEADPTSCSCTPARMMLNIGPKTQPRPMPSTNSEGARSQAVVPDPVWLIVRASATMAGSATARPACRTLRPNLGISANDDPAPITAPSDTGAIVRPARSGE
jgi:hypothetical protein